MENIETTPPPIHPQYAGFWRRFLAYGIDAIIVNIFFYAVFIPVVLILSFGGADDTVASTGFELAAVGLSLVMAWLYEAIALSSQWQATVGKAALGLMVTDVDGNRLVFVDATGRYIAKILSAVILMIGYLIQPFTKKRQALHDILAGTLVVKK